MPIESVSMLVAGLGLFFVGIRLVSNNLKQMTSRRFKLFIARFTDSGIISGLWGLISGFITQSTSVNSFIVASLISSGLITVRKSLPIIIWANAGCSTLVLFAVLDIKDFVLILLGVTGICFAFDHPQRFRYALGALFGISLLFFGLNMVSNGASPFSEYPWFKSLLFQIKDSYLLAFFIGGILAFVSQTSIGIMIIAITMTTSGILTFNQTIMIIYGAHAGSSMTSYVLSYSIKGSAKQSIMAQVLFNLIGVVLFSAMFYIEIYGDVPLVKALVGTISGDIRQQAAWVVLLFNFIVPFILSFLLTPFSRMLAYFWPPREEEALSKIKFIHEHAADTPETASLLLEKELLRLFHRIPYYLDRLRPENSENKDMDLDVYHEAFRDVSNEIQSFIADVLHKDLTIGNSETLLNIQDRHNLFIGIEDNAYQLCKFLSDNGGSRESQRLISNIIESMDAIVLTAVDATESFDAADLEILLTLTADRGPMMEKIRRSYLSSEKGLSIDDRSLVLYITNLFERTVWSLGRYGSLLSQAVSMQKG
ncbi:MAG TPA: Na/Pi symporter [Desulfobacteraceae bacterium]|nr:Na/Pi symporter [Desulfobacteraceae bacterium]HPJ66211.1 Na/Pi symporter [Desulfobacteraceae bacterium]HPQ29046.1 Na/Pi symporter [Desulfobacteraceae bacterium]